MKQEEYIPIDYWKFIRLGRAKKILEDFEGAIQEYTKAINTKKEIRNGEIRKKTKTRKRKEKLRDPGSHFLLKISYSKQSVFRRYILKRMWARFWLGF